MWESNLVEEQRKAWGQSRLEVVLSVINVTKVKLEGE